MTSASFDMSSPTDERLLLPQRLKNLSEREGECHSLAQRPPLLDLGLLLGGLERLVLVVDEEVVPVIAGKPVRPISLGLFRE